MDIERRDQLISSRARQRGSKSPYSCSQTSKPVDQGEVGKGSQVSPSDTVPRKEKSCNHQVPVGRDEYDLA